MKQDEVQRLKDIVDKLQADDGCPVTDWAEIKKLEKAGREWEDDYLPAALAEGRALID